MVSVRQPAMTSPTSATFLRKQSPSQSDAAATISVLPGGNEASYSIGADNSQKCVEVFREALTCVSP